MTQKFTSCCSLCCSHLLFARQTCAKRKLPQIPSLTHSTLLIANLRRPSSVKILEGWQLHACKLACFGPCHAIFTQRSNGIANQHCIPGTVVYSVVAMNESKHALKIGCGTMESPWFHEVPDKLQLLVLVRGCCSARCFCCFGGCGCGSSSDYARLRNCGFGLCCDHATCSC